MQYPSSEVARQTTVRRRARRGAIVATIMMIGSSLASADGAASRMQPPPPPQRSIATSAAPSDNQDDVAVAPTTAVNRMPQWLDDQSWSIEPVWLRKTPFEHYALPVESTATEGRPEPIPLPPAVMAAGPIFLTLLMLGTAVKKRRPRTRRVW
jgi:hypothetical protein